MDDTITTGGVTGQDLRFMAAAIRLSRRHTALTGTNPSVATILVAGNGVIIGRAVTEHGGRPHAEPVAIAEAGDRAGGATAYVTLEPCAHHGRTPPCAQALIDAGVSRVVGGAADPDPRVSGRGYAMLRDAGVDVVEGVLADLAADAMAGYLIHSLSNRPEVILKLAVSIDGMIGLKGKGQVAVTGPISRARVHLLRAGVHAILVGAGTARADDPQLTCRLEGLESRSPIRIVVGRPECLAPGSRLVETAREVPVWLAGEPADELVSSGLRKAGVEFIAAETVAGGVALPELLEDVAARGVHSILVEGGAEIASSLLEEGLVDRIILFRSSMELGPEGIPSPLVPETVPASFQLLRTEKLGEDDCLEWARKDRFECSPE